VPMNPHEMFRRLLSATNASEMDALAELFHPEFVAESPQSGERAHGFAGFRYQLENYPGTVEVDSQSPVTRVLGGEERWAITPNYTVVPLANPNEYTALTRARYPDGSMWWIIILVTLRDGLMFRAESYFAPALSPEQLWRGWSRGLVSDAPGRAWLLRRAAAMATALLLVGSGVVLADSFPLMGIAHAQVGNGWRLLAEVHDRSGTMAFRVRAATDNAGYSVTWQELGPAARHSDLVGSPRPPVNFDSEIVVVVGEGIGSCTTGVDLVDVVIDRSARLVHSVTRKHARCPFLDLTGSVVFVVALARDALPERPFAIQVHATPTCRSCTDHEDQVTL
jgi:hypothetical protein